MYALRYLSAKNQMFLKNMQELCLLPLLQRIAADVVKLHQM